PGDAVLPGRLAVRARGAITPERGFESRPGIHAVDRPQATPAMTRSFECFKRLHIWPKYVSFAFGVTWACRHYAGLYIALAAASPFWGLSHEEILVACRLHEPVGVVAAGPTSGRRDLRHHGS